MSKHSNEPIQSLGLTVRTQNCLLAEGVETVEQLHELASFGQAKLLRIPNLGRHSEAEIYRTLFLRFSASKCSAPNKFESSELRDDLAAKAMPIHLSILGGASWDTAEECANEVARLSYLVADAMLTQRNKT